MSEIVDSISGVNIYPIKSLQAATVQGAKPFRLEVGPTGFQVNEVRDRDFVLYDTEEDSFVTQRGWAKDSKQEKFPQDKQLASVQIDILDDHIAIKSMEGSLELPAAPIEGRPATINLWGGAFHGIDQGPEPADYFSTMLGRSIRLVRADREKPRVISENYKREGASNFVAGADGFPFLFTSHRSLEALHQQNGLRLGSVPMNRFRPNIEVNGHFLGAFEEDYIDPEIEFTIAGLGMWAVKPCARCPIPNIDQDTGTLAEAKASAILRKRVGRRVGSDRYEMFFGQNLVHRVSSGSIGQGDLVRVSGLLESPTVELKKS